MLLNELFKAFRLSQNGVARRLLEPIVKRPAQNLVNLVEEIEHAVQNNGLSSGGRVGLKLFTHLIKVSGNESIPSRGPLLIVSNHVGAFDILLLLCQLTRNDVKVIASDLPIMRSFPALYQYLIFTNFQPSAGMQAARQALRHLKDGGALLLFASAGIDPDPALDPQAAREELNKWKPSLDIFLRQVPETQVVVSIVRGVVASRWAKHPLTRIGKRPIDQRRIGEILQIIQQLVFPGNLTLEPRIQFAPPISTLALEGDSRQALIRIGDELMLRATLID